MPCRRTTSILFLPAVARAFGGINAMARPGLACKMHERSSRGRVLTLGRIGCYGPRVRSLVLGGLILAGLLLWISRPGGRPPAPLPVAATPAARAAAASEPYLLPLQTSPELTSG